MADLLLYNICIHAHECSTAAAANVLSPAKYMLPTKGGRLSEKLQHSVMKFDFCYYGQVNSLWLKWLQNGQINTFGVPFILLSMVHNSPAKQSVMGLLCLRSQMLLVTRMVTAMRWRQARPHHSHSKPQTAKRTEKGKDGLDEGNQDGLKWYRRGGRMGSRSQSMQKRRESTSTDWKGLDQAWKGILVKKCINNLN